MTNGTNKEIIDWLRDASDLTLISHVSPDGDTVGSTLALYHALGGRAQLVCEDPFPPKYAFLPGADRFVTPAGAHATRWAMAVDAADLERLGNAAPLFSQAEHTAVVDHHGTNPLYGDLCRVESDYGATGTLVYELLTEGGWPVEGPAAQCLYVAISADTGNFGHSSTKERDMRSAAALIEHFDLADTVRRMYRVKRKPHTLLLGQMLCQLHFCQGGRVAYACVTEDMIRSCQAEYADTEGLVDHIINTEGVEVALLAVEKNGDAKFSVRTLSMDAAALAVQFGGGGHPRASGMTVRGPMEPAMEQVLAAVARTLG